MKLREKWEICTKYNDKYMEDIKRLEAENKELKQLIAGKKVNTVINEDKIKDDTMNAEIKDGMLIITVPIQTPAPSASGKTLVVASSHGNQQTAATINGKPVVIGLNAYIYKDK